MRRSRTRLTLALVVGALAGGTHPAAAQDSARVAPQRRDRNLISSDMFRDARFATAYDIVEALKGNWLRTRPTRMVSTTAGALNAGRRDSAAGAPGQQLPLTEPYSSTSSDPQRSNLGADGGVQVYLDGTRMGDVEHLRNIPSAIVMAIWHYDPSDAQARFGVGHTSGVVYVSTRLLDRRP